MKNEEIYSLLRIPFAKPDFKLIHQFFDIDHFFCVYPFVMLIAPSSPLDPILNFWRAASSYFDESFCQYFL